MRSLLITLTVLALFSAAALVAQSIGSQLPGQAMMQSARTPLPDHFAAEHYISLQGSADVTVVPTSVRVVLAILSEGATAQECQAKHTARQQELTRALGGEGVAQDSIQVDFISLLPRYDWKVEEQSGQKLAVEERTGFLLQNNVAFLTDTEAQAQAGVTAAFEHGFTELIAVDYTSDELPRAKIVAQERAFAEARRKASLFLGGLFPQMPQPINLHEATQVVPPKELYRSFENVSAGSWSAAYRQDLPQVALPRPQNTYYDGQPAYADLQDGRLPIRPVLTVTSTVTLYYAAPDRPKVGAAHDGLPR